MRLMTLDTFSRASSFQINSGFSWEPANEMFTWVNLVYKV